MDTIYTPEVVRRLEACLLEFGWVRGHDFNDVYVDNDGNLCISHPTSWDRDQRHQRIMHRAFTVCGVTDVPFDAWMAGEEAS